MEFPLTEMFISLKRKSVLRLFDASIKSLVERYDY